MRVCTESCIQLRFINVNISQLAEKKKGIGPFSNSVISQSHIYPHPEECNAGFFEVNLSGGVYEAHGEDFSFESFCLPVHPAGRVCHGRLGARSAMLLGKVVCTFGQGLISRRRPCPPEWALSNVETTMDGLGLYDKNRPCPKLICVL